MDTWYTVAPVTSKYCCSDLGLTKPINLGNGVYLSEIPSWIKNDNITKDLSTDNRDFIESDVKYMLFAKYKAQSLGDPFSPQKATGKRSKQDVFLERIQISNLLLWLVNPSALNFKMFFHIDEVTGKKYLRQFASVAPLRPHHRDSGNMIKKEKLLKIYSLNKKIKTLDRKGPFWMALRTLWSALTASTWEPRFLLLWVTLEALFGSDRELSFKIPLRICCFITKNKSHKRIIFYNAKKGYTWRSKIVHGMRLISLSRSESETVLFNTELMIRNSVLKILRSKKLIEIFSNHNKREKYLDTLVF